MRIVDAAHTALLGLGRPASVREIYEEIQRRDLFVFGAKDPVSILSKTIRKSTQESPTLRGEPRFEVSERLYRTISRSE